MIVILAVPIMPAPPAVAEGAQTDASGLPGPALRSGLKALEAGAHDTAARIFAGARERHEIVSDHAARWEAEAHLRGGRPAEAARLAGDGANAAPRGVLASTFLRIEASARSELAETAAARSAWKRAAKLESDAEERALLLAEIARSHESDGERAAARDVWIGIWSELAATPTAEDAAAALERLDDGARPRRGEGLVLRARCDALTDARHNEAALEACARARAATPERAAQRALDRRRADLLFRLRRYPEARAAYAALPGREARFRTARSMARSGQIRESIAAFEELGRGNDSLAARARFLAATLWDDSDVAAANRLFRSVAERAPVASQRLEASWRLGWAAYRAGEYTEAADRLRQVAANAADPIEALRGRYWAARSQQNAGEPAGGQRLGEIARDFPFTYYGWRAAAAAPDTVRPERHGPHLRTEPADSRLPERTLERARILVEAGLFDDATRELASVRTSARSRSDRVLLASLFQDAGDHHLAQRVVVDAHLLDLARGPGHDDPDLWWSAYPNAFASEVEASVAGRDVDAALLYAVMREESGYRPKVISVVGARGLAQIMPETGKRLASQLKIAGFHPDQLFTPERNLDLAGHYLESLLRRFDGRASAAVASYNAGPAAVARWLSGGADLADDEWVEAIPYDQTRAYVKRVLRSRYAYEVLY